MSLSHSCGRLAMRPAPASSCWCKFGYTPYFVPSAGIHPGRPASDWRSRRRLVTSCIESLSQRRNRCAAPFLPDLRRQPHAVNGSADDSDFQLAPIVIILASNFDSLFPPQSLRPSPVPLCRSASTGSSYPGALCRLLRFARPLPSRPPPRQALVLSRCLPSAGGTSSWIRPTASSDAWALPGHEVPSQPVAFQVLALPGKPLSHLRVSMFCLLFLSRVSVMSFGKRSELRNPLGALTAAFPVHICAGG